MLYNKKAHTFLYKPFTEPLLVIKRPLSFIVGYKKTTEYF